VCRDRAGIDPGHDTLAFQGGCCEALVVRGMRGPGDDGGRLKK
jgi:hypothetical protein